MGWLAALLYAAAAGMITIYAVYIDAPNADRTNLGTLMFPNGHAVGCFVMCVLLLAAAAMATVAAQKKPSSPHRVSSTTPTPGMDQTALQAPVAKSGLRIIPGQFWDDYDGMRFAKHFNPTRRKVTWIDGAHIGWLDPTVYKGWSVSTADGEPLGEAADIPSAAALLRSHLARS